MRLPYLIALLLIITSCKNTNKTPLVADNNTLSNSPAETVQPLQTSITYEKDTITLSTKHNPNFIIADLDGDNHPDSVKLVQHIANKKFGLLIKFGNNTTATFGLGQDVLQQGFDDLDWVGVFEKANKGDVYYNNVNDDGEIMSEEQVPEKDKIKLPHDAIFIHAAESCGGGIIYFNTGKFNWIQQE